MQLMHIHSVDERHVRVHAHMNGQTDADLHSIFFFLLLDSTSGPTPTNTLFNISTDVLLRSEKENMLRL